MWICLYWAVVCCVSVTDCVKKGFDPCCSFPCQHGSVCLSHDGDFSCDCVGLEYSGIHCQIPTWTRSLKNLISPGEEMRQWITSGFRPLWAIINRVPYLHKKAMRYIYLSRGSVVESPPKYNGGWDYTTLDVYFNRSYYVRSLPPVPVSCPTPMGVAGTPQQPTVEQVFDVVLRRREFKPCPFGTNVLFATYAQHFVHQFFKTSSQGSMFTWGDEGVDGSQIYGKDETDRRLLRAMDLGKLKTQLINGEEFPPFLHVVPDIEMMYPVNGSMDVYGMPFTVTEDPHPKWAMGHKFFSVSPTIFVVATLWLREHNRVCELLYNEHMDWDDERLYQTARLIIIGEYNKITVEEYVQHLSQYSINLRYDPQLIHGSSFQYSNRIRQEFNHLYYWHPFLAAEFHVDSKTYNFTDLLFSNNHIVLDHGMRSIVSAMVTNIAGSLTYRNHGELAAHMGRAAIRKGRIVRMQSFNNYRRHFNMKPYKTFLELTGDKQLAEQVQKLYKDIEALEFYPGMMLEKHTFAVTPPSMVAMGGPYAIKGIMTNPIGTPGWWKPSTFGGPVGFNIIKTATLRKLICLNLKDGCGDIPIGFSVPKDTMEKYKDK